MEENKDLLEKRAPEESSDYFTSADRADQTALEDSNAAGIPEAAPAEDISEPEEAVSVTPAEAGEKTVLAAEPSDAATADSFAGLAAGTVPAEEEVSFARQEEQEEIKRAAERAQEEAKLAAERQALEAQWKAEEEAKRVAEEEARRKAEEETRLAAEREAQEVKKKAEEQARIDAQKKAIQEQKDAEKAARKEQRRLKREARKQAMKDWVPGPKFPNQLTIARICMIPLFVVLILWVPKPLGNILAMIVFIIAALTDTADGYIARKYNYVSTFGKFMDPLADKLLVCSALICLVDLGRIESWIVIIIIAREFIISGFRLVAAEKGVVIAANIWGKVKTVLQMIMVVLMVGNFGGFLGVAAQVLKWAALALTLLSLATYLIQNRHMLRDETADPEQDQPPVQ